MKWDLINILSLIPLFHICFTPQLPPLSYSVDLQVIISYRIVHSFYVASRFTVDQFNSWSDGHLTIAYPSFHSPPATRAGLTSVNILHLCYFINIFVWDHPSMARDTPPIPTFFSRSSESHRSKLGVKSFTRINLHLLYWYCSWERHESHHF